jgi:hypothetical protein
MPKARKVRWRWLCECCKRTHARYRGEQECTNLRCACGNTTFVKSVERAPENRD